MRKKILIPTLLFCYLLQSCADIKSPIKSFGKSSIEQILDLHIEFHKQSVAKLTLMLYERNPHELAKNPNLTLENRLTQILEHPTDISYKEIHHTQAVDTINLIWDRNYKNDLVFALGLGIHSMIRHSYDNKSELTQLDKLDPQVLYDSARNLERIMWRLRTETRHGKLLLTLGPTYGQDSFEDIIIRMISIQDIVAKTVAIRNKQIINQVMRGVATILIPIPF